MSEFITIGEPLVVFCSTEPDVSLTDAVNFRKVIGGAELNVAIGLRRLGHTVDYITQVGMDPEGDFICKKIHDMHIGTRYLYQTSDHLTGYQMKQLVSKGDPYVYNFRNDSAAANFDINKLSDLDLRQTRFAHITGIFPALSRKTYNMTLALMKKLNQRNITITFDPNLRLQLWEDQATMVKTINYLAQYADIMMPGQSEGKVLTGYENPDKIANFYLSNRQTKVVFVKVGSKGSFFKAKTGETGFIDSFKVKKVVDTVGAGDGFALGVISALMEDKTYSQAAKRGNAIGALQVQVHGDNDGYPNRTELEQFYKENGVNE